MHDARNLDEVAAAVANRAFDQLPLPGRGATQCIDDR